jgi:excinuclease ABC subunit A
LLDQKPIGKNSRSNPATYLKAWDEVRKILASQPLSLTRGYTPMHFSFNVDGGRCPTCKGEGLTTIDLHFMASIQMTCEDCQGKRFTSPVLDVKFKNKNVSEILNMTVDESIAHFFEYPELRRKLQLLHDVGLGYVTIGQSAPTLSGGESQRLKIAAALDQEVMGSELYILDEPTTGLHVDDVKILLKLLQDLVNRGKSVLVIEHNTDIMLNADWIIDFGPGAGNDGGAIVAEGAPEIITSKKHSVTGQVLAKIMN